MIWINFKTYPEATGAKASVLAKACFSVASETGVSIVPVVQATDIYRVGQEAGGPVWAQHVDGLPVGRQTGWVVPEALLGAGAEGTLLNHSEHKLPAEEMAGYLKLVQAKGLKAMVCCSSLAEAEICASFKPDYLAYEPPELIGSTQASVATARAGVVADFVARFADLPVIIGAGIQGEADIMTGLRLGAKGFLVSSAVVQAADPQEALMILAKTYQENKEGTGE